ncbi:DUF881 domain-containing protein [Pseudokineococcus basanitobsidens]|uniref:DUF881 domain-containing protein n=1 Tax=Pseudokineococcus basanitobsidens TaxID=1926649 RepID=A0ABU8RIY7_9ACTN
MSDHGTGPAAASGARPARPDASMTLLREVMERPLDPGYAAAAARRGGGGAAPSRRRTRTLTAGLAALAGAATVVGVVQLRAPAAEGTTAALRDQVAQRQEEVGALEQQVERARADVVDAEEAVLGPEPGAGGGSGALALTTGDVAVRGPGVRVVVDDAPSAGADASGSPRTDAEADAGRVRDRDLQVLVDGLWAAGAQAVSVGGQRLTARTAVRGAGEAVLVGYQPLSPPYELLAVGDPGEVSAGFARSAGGRYAAALAEYGITVDVSTEEELHLPAAVGLRPELARPLDGSDDDGAPGGAADGGGASGEGS